MLESREVSCSLTLPDPEFSDPELFDLGVLRQRRRAGTLTFYAPGLLTRAVWLAGVVACGVYLYSVALALAWSVRPPRLSETPFWSLPLLLGGLFGLLASGGVRLSLGTSGLELQHFWPQRSRLTLVWTDLRGVYFFEERTRSREQLYGMRFRFPTIEVTFRTVDAAVWQELKTWFAERR